MSQQTAAYQSPHLTAAPALDQHLLQACRAGDEAAWNRLLDTYERLVYSIPLNYGLSAEDADDITQLVFTALIQRLEDLSDDSNLAGWLTVVARRHTWRVLYRRRREIIKDFDHESISSLLPSRTNPIEQWELTEWLHRGLSLISERCRTLLLALYFDAEEPSYAELAQRFGIPQGSIGPTRARCLQRLQQMLTR